MDDGEFTIKLDIIVPEKFFKKAQLFITESVEVKEENLPQMEGETNVEALK